MPILREACPGDASAIAHVHVEAWRSTYRDLLPAPFLDGLSVVDRAAMWAKVLASPDPSRPVVVAEQGGRLLGFASGGPERGGHLGYPGELYAIYLLEEAQRRGIGQRLARVIAERLLEAGMTGMIVWVLSENPACRFYEALGGRRIATKTDSLGGVSVEETAFGWEQLHRFGR